MGIYQDALCRRAGRQARRAGGVPLKNYALARMKSRLHKTGTVDTYEVHLRNHIMPVFGDHGLAAIGPTMVQQWIKDLQSVKGLAPRTIETIYVIFASIMRGAVRDGYIRETPCVDIRLPEISKTIVRLLTPVQVPALADVMPQRYALLVLLGASAGLRQGEAFGLALDRIDGTTGMITIDRQVVVVDRCPVLAPPSSPPRIAGPGAGAAAAVAEALVITIAVLGALVLLGGTAFVAYRLRHGTGKRWQPGPGLLLITNRLGSPVQRNSFGFCWREAVKEAKLPEGTRFHDLRHFYASTLIAAGVHPKVIQDRLGQATIAETMDTYGHLFPDASEQGRGALDAMFAPADVRPMCAKR